MCVWWRCLSLLFTIHCSLFTISAQSKLDSLQHVREIVVVSKPAMREVVPSQKLNGEMLEKLNTHSVADALRYFSGIQLKDYGGVGGIKTVNIRSMGTHHLGISYDGIELGNAQNGQIDLAQFSLDNVEEITLFNGQKILNEVPLSSDLPGVFLDPYTSAIGDSVTLWALFNKDNDKGNV